MPVTNVTNDPAARTMTLTAEFDATVARVWQLYDDPRQLEKWWGPTEANVTLTITDHDLSVGGYVRAYVTPPEGEKVHAYWRITAVNAPNRLEWEDGFLDDQGEPNLDLPPTAMQLTLAERAGGGTVMTIVVSFDSPESMQWYLDMDIAEEMTRSIAQGDALLLS